MTEKKNGQKKAEVDLDLRQEVSAVASQLGLVASIGEEADFDDTDFRPVRKAPRAAGDAKPNAGLRSATRETAFTAVRPGKSADGRPAKAPQPRAAEAQKNEAGRVWKTSVGPRPGIPLH